MTRRIRIEVGAATVSAVLLDATAPIACARLWDALPVETTARHARTSGGALYVLDERLKDAAYRAPDHAVLGLPENFCTFMQIGSLNYFAPLGELLLCYDQAQARDRSGNMWVGRIAELEGDLAPLRAEAAKIQHVASATMRISRAE